MRRVEMHGYGDRIGHALAGDECFSAAPAEWQAEVVDRFVIMPLEHSSASYIDFHATDVFRHLRSIGCIRPDAQAFLNKEDEAAVASRIPGFRPPFKVVQAFLGSIEAGGLVDRRGNRWRVSDEAARRWRERRARAEELTRWAVELRSSAVRLLQKAEPQQVTGFDHAAWWKGPQPSVGISFDEAIRVDDRRLTTLAHLLNRIEGMLLRNGEMVDDLLGLPLAGAVRRELDARDAKEQARVRIAAEEEMREADAREAALVREAAKALRHHAPVWLDREDDALREKPGAVARRSQEGLHRARGSLREAAAEQERFDRRERLQGRMMTLASTMRQPERARVFLTTTHPEWRGGRPIDTCIDDMSFEALRKAMVRVAS